VKSTVPTGNYLISSDYLVAKAICNVSFIIAPPGHGVLPGLEDTVCCSAPGGGLWPILSPFLMYTLLSGARGLFPHAALSENGTPVYMPPFRVRGGMGVGPGAWA
jgi:hypothetical protein